MSVPVAQLDELRALLRLLGEQDAVVGEDADREAVEVGPAAHQRRAVERLELLEPRAVDDARDHLAHVERHADVGRRDAEQLLGVVARRLDGARAAAGPRLRQSRCATISRPMRMRVALVGGEVVGEAARCAACISAPPSYSSSASSSIAIFTSGGPPRKTCAASFMQHDVVAHARHVGAAGGRGAEDEGDRRDAGGREPREVPEARAAGHEDLRLLRQVGAGRLGQRTSGSRLLRAISIARSALATRRRPWRAALDRRVVRR